MSGVHSIYTCITCQVAFDGPELQRSHYKTDWHRYNLKRKVVDLPPVTAETFKERVLALKMEESLSVEEKHLYCAPCRKTFSSDKSFESHQRSQKHKSIVKKNGETSPQKVKTTSKSETGIKEEEEDIEEVEDGEPLTVTECLFCLHCEEDMESNLDHMSRAHGFFIPDIQYLTDLKGLIEYLGEKVGSGNLCLYCNERGKTFFTIEAVQHHMIDKCHCKIFFEGDAALEYAEFYDYTKSYPDEGSPDDDVVHSALTVNDDLELVLPSGAMLGHRYLKNHYKQRVPLMVTRKPSLVSKVVANYRAIGWKESSDAVKRQRDVAWASKMAQQRKMKLSVKANSFQKHFRPQVVF